MASTPTTPVPGGDASKTLGKAERSAREAYHGGTDAPDGDHALGRKDPEQSGDSGREDENVPRR